MSEEELVEIQTVVGEEAADEVELGIAVVDVDSDLEGVR